ncbi:MAG: peptide deformylase [Longimicrobiales bacterium]
MSVREVKLLGEPVLRKRADEVQLQINSDASAQMPKFEMTDDLRKLIADMFDTMYAEEGIGLAAPQIGESVRVIVVDPHEEGVEPFALVNPRITEFSDETDRAEEGCLSVPGLREVVERPMQVVVEGIDPAGRPTRIEAGGLVARILQHEVDHIDGIMFLDRVSPLKRKMLLKKWQKVKPDAE